MATTDTDADGYDGSGPETCPECDGQLRAIDGETVCEACGLVVDVYRIDHGPDWRSFDDTAENPKRVGAPRTETRHDHGLTTEMGWSVGIQMSPEKRRQLGRLRREHSRTQVGSKLERNRIYANTEIKRVTDRLDLPSHVAERACRLFRTAHEENLLQGRSLEGFAAAALYATCRVSELSRTMEEVVDVSKATYDELQMSYDVLNRELGLPTGPINPAEYVPRFASKLNLATEVEQHATDLARKAHDSADFAGKNPSGIAAGCLYAVAQEHDADATQAALAELAGVSTITVRNNWHEVVELDEE